MLSGFPCQGSRRDADGQSVRKGSLSSRSIDQAFALKVPWAYTLEIVDYDWLNCKLSDVSGVRAIELSTQQLGKVGINPQSG